MLRQTPKHIRDCHDRAADCRQKAKAAPDRDGAAFWREQEAHWLKLAESYDLSSRITSFLELPSDRPFSPEAEEGVQALVDIFDRVCRTLDLDLSDETHARKIARTLIEAAIGGESDPEALFARAVTAVSS